LFRKENSNAYSEDYMGDHTSIAWCDHSWSPWIGCTKVSPGCLNCYAEARDKRHLLEDVDHWGPGKPRWRTRDWRKPRRWNKSAGQLERRPRVFPSLCDWLDPEVPIEWLADLLAVIHDTPRLDWLLLTKRPELWPARVYSAVHVRHHWAVDWLNGTPPPNVWIGVSVEDQERADERIPALLHIPAHIRWLSCEPLLGPIMLDRSWLTGDSWETPIGRHMDWVVIGGESGLQARPCHLAWIRSIRDQCRGAQVPVFVKQCSGQRPGQQGLIPDELWNIKQFPESDRTEFSRRKNSLSKTAAILPPAERSGSPFEALSVHA